MSNLSRRKFIKKAAITSAVIGFPTVIPVSAMGRNGKVAPNDRVNIGVIACGGRSGVTNDYNDIENSQVIAVCDPVLERRMAKKAKFGNCADYNDFRELLALKEVDAVHISTADHWHVPISLAAARAGKDMYTEKPLGISIQQDLAAREILDKHNRILVLIL